MRKLMIKTIFLMLPIALLVTGSNYYVDPAHQFSDNYYQEAAKILKHDNIILIGNCDEKKLIKSFIKQKNKVKTIILGSSRSLILNEEHIQSTSMLNLSSSGSDLEDIIATYGLYESRHGKPEDVVIGIDPWMFNVNRKSTRFMSFLDSYNKMADKLKLNKVNSTIINHSTFFEVLFSLSYFQTSLLSVFENGLYKITPQKIVGTSSKQKIKTSNGTLIYGLDWQNKKELIEIAAKRYISEKDIYGLNAYFEVSSERVEILERTFKYLQNNDISIKIFLSPYHPIVWDYFESNSKRYSVVKNSELALRNLCKKYHIQIIGSFSPENMKLTSTDFYDGMHPNLNGIGKIFTEVNKDEVY